MVRGMNNATPNISLTSEQFQQLLATAQGNNNTRNAPNAPATTCTYKDFMNCKPSNFKGTEGPVELTRWFEKMESVFSISNCSDADRVKYATCTLSGGALTWWNAYVQTVGLDAAVATPWATVKRMMTEKYCPRNQVQRMETELWELRVKNNDIDAYNNRFLELASLCPGMVTPEYKKIERYVEGLPAEIQGNVMSAGKETIDGVIHLAQDLMMAMKRRAASNKPIDTRAGDNKRKADDQSRGSNLYPSKKSAEGTAGSSKNGFKGKKPLCKRCEKYHHGKCLVECTNCKKLGHLAKNCRIAAAPARDAKPFVPTCYGCGEHGHYKSQCPKKDDAGNAKARAYVITAEETSEETDETEEST